MNVEATSLTGTYMLLPEIHLDDRGEFWRPFCRREFIDHGIGFEVCQSNVSVNPHLHTLRGFHYQKPPSNEQKLLTVVLGSVYLVVVDIRPESPTFMSHEAFHFEVGDRSSLLIPGNCATGFLTLVEQTIVHYQMGDYFLPESYHGFRYDDPSFGVEWPTEPAVMSDRDRGFARFDPAKL